MECISNTFFELFMIVKYVYVVEHVYFSNDARDEIWEEKQFIFSPKNFKIGFPVVLECFYIFHASNIFQFEVVKIESDFNASYNFLQHLDLSNNYRFQKHTIHIKDIKQICSICLSYKNLLNWWKVIKLLLNYSTSNL